MTKKQKSSKEQKRPQSKEKSSVNPSVQASQQQKNLRQRQLTQFISHKKSQKPLIAKKVLQIEPQPVQKQAIHLQKQKPSTPSKLNRKISKKKKGKSKPDSSGKKGTVKLQRGYKFCQNCKTILNIHKYVCTECGFVHNMKKHKFDVMKNLSKGTPKIVRSIIEANEFNTIKLTSFDRSNLYPQSFFFGNLESERKPQSQLRKGQENELKRTKSQSNGQKISLNRVKSQSSVVSKGLVNKEIQQPVSSFISQSKICFRPIEIKKIENLHSFKSQEKTHKKYNKTRQEFSIYQSSYPIVVMQPIQIQSQLNHSENLQFLLFTQSASKKQIINEQTHLLSGLAQENRDEIESLNFESNSDSEIVNRQEQNINAKKQAKQFKAKKEQERKDMKKIIQRNAITQKAFGLQKFHRIGTVYDGQTIINIMSVNTPNKSLQLQEKIEEKTKRVSSTRQSKQEASKVLETEKKLNQENQFDITKIRIKEHVEMVKSIKNKVAILTGKKSILLMNINLLTGQTQKDGEKMLTRENKSSTSWLTSTDFDSENSHFMSSNKKQSSSKKYLTKISLSTTDVPSLEDDQFLVIEWLKLFSQYKETQRDKDEKDVLYLATGTLNGHIIVYSISPQNSFTIYRTIIGAHFEFINCIKQCPLNIGGTSIFASGSFDGSVKVWDLQFQHTICQFEVSNRKIQQIHWDSGAKFLIVVRDEGLENCYLSCFYSVSNRVELPIMLTDTIDFRLIRNGILFDNSCSPLITFPLNSKLVVMLNSRNGFFKILETEELRKTSLKRKKSKKNCQQEIYHDYWIRLNKKRTSQFSDGKNDSKETENIFNCIQSHQVIQMIANSNAGLYNKLGFSSVQEPDDENQNQHVLSPIDDSQSDDSDQKSDIVEKKPSALNDKPEKSIKKVVNKIEPIPQLVEPIALRKSLRARKPIIQYNFIEEQEEPQEEQKPKKFASKKQKSKRKQESDSQQFFDEEQDSSLPEGSESDKSFIQNKNKVSQSKVKNIKKQTNLQKSKSNPKKADAKVISQIKSLRNRDPSNQIEKKEEIEGPTAEELLCKLFWQQTSEESLANQKEEFPSNRLPKFSSIVSFVTSFHTKNKLKDRNEANAEQEENEGFSESQEISPSLEEGSESQRHSNDKRQKSKQSEYSGQRSQSKLEYLTTFIAGYVGQLIKVKVKIEGYQRNEENQAGN